ncbi:AaceriAER333Cp [[Ashbya] aceris (nom. inval.)]|nr:AaceriAER333Cp [[Ashbya] aceris (nom. inval.)]
MKQNKRKYSGFVQSVGITCVLILIILWTLLPYPLSDPEKRLREPQTTTESISLFLDELVELFPQRYWILCIQCMILMDMLFVYIGLPIFNQSILTVRLDDLRTITDSKASVVMCESHAEFLTSYAHTETSGVYDLPITEVSRLLYGKARHKSD